MGLRGRKRPSNKYRIIIVTILLFIFPDSLFAQTATENTELTDAGIIQFMNDIIALASRVWVIPAKLAGLFMTNAFIYGEKFYLTQYLFKFWQIIRTFAYFTLGFYFVGNILYARFHQGEESTDIPKLIKNTIVSGFLIGGSWWLIATCVDLSIVFTSAVASIPTQIYETTWAQEKQQCFNAPKVITISQMKIDPNLLSNKDNRKPIERTDIKPNGDDVSGPLTFFGIGVLGFFDMVYLPEGIKGEEQRINSKTLILVFVKAIMAIMLVIPMVTLMIVNLMRIVYLWLRIVFSPFIVLINVFEIDIGEGIKKHVDAKNMVGLIMQPVAVIGMISIGVILIIELATIFNLCTKPNESVGNPIQTTTIKEAIPTLGDLSSNAGAEITIGASLSALGETMGGITGELILAIIIIMILRSLFTVGFSFSELTRGVSETISKGATDYMGSIPIIPVGEGQRIGMTVAKQQYDQNFGLNNYLRVKSANQVDNLYDTLGINQGKISATKFSELKSNAGASNMKLNTLKEKIKEAIKEVTIDREQAKEILNTWLQNGTKNDIDSLNKEGFSALKNLDKESLEKMRTNEKKNDANRLLNRLFNGNKNDTSSNITSYGNSSKS